MDKQTAITKATAAADTVQQGNSISDQHPVPDTPLTLEAAYAAAPDTYLEGEELIRLRRTAGIGRREWLLRFAALQDRQTATADLSDGKAQTAVQRAFDTLTAYDTEHGTAAGPAGPDAPQWVACPRGYIRQEYKAWSTAQ